MNLYSSLIKNFPVHEVELSYKKVEKVSSGE